MMSIKECPEYKWNPNEVCLNGLNCQELIRLPYRLMNHRIKMYKKITCKCPEKYSIQCSEKYCASDKRGCDETKFNQTNVKINSCVNGHKIVN